MSLSASDSVIFVTGIPVHFETILAISFCIVGGEEVATAQYTFSVAELIG